MQIQITQGSAKTQASYSVGPRQLKFLESNQIPGEVVAAELATHEFKSSLQCPRGIWHRVFLQ